jgi:hypothetical protein
MKLQYRKILKKTRMLALTVLCFVSSALVASGAGAQPTGAQTEAPSTQKVQSNSTQQYGGGRVSYLNFVNKSMQEVYDNCFFWTIDGVAWVKPKIGISAEFSYITDKGTPLRTASNWNLSDSWVKLTAIPIGINFLYKFTSGSKQEFASPYVGLGPTLWIGGERIYANASRMRYGIHEAFEANLLAMSIFAGGQLLCGSTFRLGESFRGVVEIRWSQTSSGGLSDLVQEEDKGRIEPKLYGAVERSDFDFSGWRIDLGMQW